MATAKQQESKAPDSMGAPVVTSLGAAMRANPKAFCVVLAEEGKPQQVLFRSFEIRDGKVEPQGLRDSKSNVTSDVKVAPDSVLLRSSVKGTVSIGKGAVLDNSKVDGEVSIGSGATLEGTEIIGAGVVPSGIKLRDLTFWGDDPKTRITQ